MNLRSRIKRINFCYWFKEGDTGICLEVRGKNRMQRDYERTRIDGLAPWTEA